jgi:hypothetical protein
MRATDSIPGQACRSAVYLQDRRDRPYCLFPDMTSATYQSHAHSPVLRRFASLLEPKTDSEL